LDADLVNIRRLLCKKNLTIQGFVFRNRHYMVDISNKINQIVQLIELSKLCKFIDEQIISQHKKKNWTVNDVNNAFKIIVNEGYTTTLFDSLIKNLENDRALYDFVFDLIINGKTLNFTISTPLIYKANMYEIISGSKGICKIHNRIFEQKIYAHMMSHEHIKNRTNLFTCHEYYTDDNKLDIKLILQKFQSFMKENYSNRDQQFWKGKAGSCFSLFSDQILMAKVLILKNLM